jgi:murein DD-endopeptidase MepM/ murein hydrolase activator NlpD
MSTRTRLAALLVISLAVIGPRGGYVVHAVPTGITFASISPIVNGSLLVALTAADNPLHSPTFQLKADIRLDNSAGIDRTVTLVTISYPGSGLSSFTYTPMSFPAAPDPPAMFVIPAGNQGKVPVYDGLNRDLPLPLPSTVRIRIYLNNDRIPLQLDYGLALRTNATSNGAYLFPARASDLEFGQYWWFPTRHVVDAGGGGGSLNPSTGTQRHALDLEVVKWNGSGWSYKKPNTSGDANSDHWAYGIPLYAMADGVITSCYRGESDHQPGGFDDITYENTFGNTLFIQHGNEIAKLAHMKNGTIPFALCPADGQNNDLNIPVVAGQFLGRVGNTGRSTRPHLHLQVEHLPSNEPVAGVPINFFNIRALADDVSINNLGGSPTLAPLNWMTLHRNSLILPNPCNFCIPLRDFAESHPIDIPGPCYQDVLYEMASRGYRPAFVNSYDVRGETVFRVQFVRGVRR